MTVRFYSSIAQQTTLQSGISAATTVIQVVATTGFPSTTPYTLSLDYNAPNEELVEVTGVAGTSLTVTRAIDGTSATIHNAGAIVRHVSSARDFTDSRTHENATTNIHGLAPGSAIVGTNDSQTLTNKTIQSPAITGTVTGSATYNTPTITTPTVTGNETLNGRLIQTGQADAVQGIFKANGTQTANILEVQSSGGTPLVFVDKDGTLNASKGEIVTAESSSDIAAKISGVASQSANVLQVDATPTLTDVVHVTGAGVFATSKGTILVGDPSPSTGGVVIKAGPSSNFIAEFRDTSNVMQASVWPDGSGHFTYMVEDGQPWIAYNPVWTTAGTAPALGNGTLVGRYRQQGKSVTAEIKFTAGTTTTFGTGAWSFSTPSAFQNAASTNTDYIGKAFANDASVGTAGYSLGVCFIASGGNQFQSYFGNTAVASITTNANPMTWANADRLWLNITYEAP